MSEPETETPDDVPELGDEFFARAKPAAAVMPDLFMSAVRRRTGRPPKEEPKARGRL
jgi:hypothetical protein